MLKIMLGILAFAFLVVAVIFFKTNYSQETPTLNIPKEDITLAYPTGESTITSPLKVSGQAKGTWFFEANFPLILTDWDGRIIAEGYATAQGDWMTEEHVPFTGTLTFSEPEYIGEFSKRGSFILKKANPSGLPEHDDALEITIFFDNEK